MLAVLLDPEKCRREILSLTLTELDKVKPDFIFIGGSSKSCSPDNLLNELKRYDVPKVLFPGDASQFNSNADALLFLSLLSGRNADYLIGQHVRSAIEIKQTGMEVIPTGYILMDGGTISSVSKVSHTKPISINDINNVHATSIAGELLGMKLIYLEAGSGAENPIPSNIISVVKNGIDIPLIVGGGLNSTTQLKTTFEAGADIAVIGNHFETHPEAISEFVHFLNAHINK